MIEVSPEEAVAQLVAILDETFEKPPGDWHHFTDVSPDSGYFGTLAKLNDKEAGRAVSGTSVAEQVRHVTFVLETATALLRGDSESPGVNEWQASWEVEKLDDPTWRWLQQELRGSYGRLRDSIQSHPPTNAQALGSAVGTIAHVAYHLGSIKQKVAMLGEAG